jgi:hypothetical protein
MAAPKRYEITAKGAMQWAAGELEHVGRIASVMDPDIQYAYAMSTLNGMAHLKDALFELVTDPDYESYHKDLQRTHDAVVRTMKHLVATYGLDLDAIRAFNTHGTLSNLGYLNGEAEDAEEAEEAEEAANNAMNVMPNAAKAANAMNVMPNATNNTTKGAKTAKGSNNYQTRNTIDRMQDGGRKTRRSRGRHSRRR